MNKHIRDFMELPVNEQGRLIESYNKQKDIYRRWRTITKEIESAKKNLETLQEECTHPFATKTHKANTGNYSAVDDSYWTEFKCPDCGKFWTEEGSK